MAEVVHRIIVKIYLGNVTRQVSVNVGALEEFTFEMFCQRINAVAPDVDLSQLRWKEPIEGDFIHLATTAGLYEALLNLEPVLGGKEILRIYGSTIAVPSVGNVVESRSVSQQHNSSDDSSQVSNGAASTEADFVLVKVEEMRDEVEATKETVGGSGARSVPAGVAEEASATPNVGDAASEIVVTGLRNVLSNNTSTPIFPVISNVCSESMDSHRESNANVVETEPGANVIKQDDACASAKRASLRQMKRAPKDSLDLLSSSSTGEQASSVPKKPKRESKGSCPKPVFPCRCCSKPVGPGSLNCAMCGRWHHQWCTNLTKKERNEIWAKHLAWYCPECALLEIPKEDGSQQLVLQSREVTDLKQETDGTVESNPENAIGKTTLKFTREELLAKGESYIIAMLNEWELDDTQIAMLDDVLLELGGGKNAIPVSAELSAAIAGPILKTDKKKKSIFKRVGLKKFLTKKKKSKRTNDFKLRKLHTKSARRVSQGTCLLPTLLIPALNPDWKGDTGLQSEDDEGKPAIQEKPVNSPTLVKQSKSPKKKEIDETALVKAPLVCSKCGRDFVYQANYLRHLIDVHGHPKAKKPQPSRSHSLIHGKSEMSQLRFKEILHYLSKHLNILAGRSGMDGFIVVRTPQLLVQDFCELVWIATEFETADKIGNHMKVLQITLDAKNVGDPSQPSTSKARKGEVTFEPDAEKRRQSVYRNTMALKSKMQKLIEENVAVIMRTWTEKETKCFVSNNLEFSGHLQHLCEFDEAVEQLQAD